MEFRTMTQHEDLKAQARSKARDILANSQSFHGMDRTEQMALYKDLVNTHYQELAEQSGLVTAMGDRGASTLIDDKRHQNQRIEQAGKLGADFIKSVDFPQFVSDLLQGVFDANLNVTVKQMQAYQELVKTATASLSKFVNDVNDEEAYAYLAENQGNQFSFRMLDDDDDDDGKGKKSTLTDKTGKAVDLGNNEIKAKIMDAKLALAKERRALLRETLLMGVSRLVVEKGTVKAAVVFDVKATEDIQKKDMAQENRQARSARTSGGIAALFTGGGSETKQRSQISVASAKSSSSTDLAANITGSVEINFKSDYFKLDNFLQMYGPIPGAAPTPQGQLAPGQSIPGQPAHATPAPAEQSQPVAAQG
jgi:hypothetical protein